MCYNHLKVSFDGGQFYYGAKEIPPSGMDESSVHACHTACCGAALHGCHGEAEDLLPYQVYHRHTLSGLRHVPRFGMSAPVGSVRLAAQQSSLAAVHDDDHSAYQPRYMSAGTGQHESQGYSDRNRLRFYNCRLYSENGFFYNSVRDCAIP